jgi:hypothetical protein
LHVQLSRSKSSTDKLNPNPQPATIPPHAWQ